MDLGLTGGIASGKSTVSNMLRERGAKIVDADRISREIVLPGSPVLEQIAEEFGPEVIQEDGTLDRKKLGSIIFGDKEKRLKLNAIMHPKIREEMKMRIAQYEAEDPDGLVVADIPLLYESNLQQMFTEVMVVYVPYDVQLQRLMERDELSEAEAKERIASQMSLEDKRERADIVIDNSRSLQETATQIELYLQRKGLR